MGNRSDEAYYEEVVHYEHMVIFFVCIIYSHDPFYLHIKFHDVC